LPIETIKGRALGLRPTTSIVIVNYNSGPFLLHAVESVRKFTADYELIVVDNASIDGSVGHLSDFHDVSIVRLSRNQGFSKANNVGIRMARGRYVVLLNSDTRVEQRWLEKLIEAAEAVAEVGIVSPKLLRLDGRLDSTGHVFHFKDCSVEDRGTGEIDSGQYDQVNKLISCSFACVLIKRKLFEMTGLLDEKMFFYFEDVDFCIRARLAGWQVSFCPLSVVYHARGGSTRSYRGSRLANRSRAYALRIIVKNYEAKDALVCGIRQVGLLLAGVVAGLKNGDADYSVGRLYSVLWNIVRAPLSERSRVQATRTISDSELLST